MNGKYILDENGNPVETKDLDSWGRWMQAADRKVAKTKINGMTVSTVFLGFDHAWDNGPPLLWETMVFGGPLDQKQDRCGGSKTDAETMHARMCERVTNFNLENGD